MKHFFAFLRTGVLSLLCLLAPAMVLAASPAPVNAPSFLTSNYLNTAANTAGVPTNKQLPEVIGSIINVILGLLGTILFIYLLYGGFLWMTSGGSQDNVKKAQTMIKNAVIGLLIIVAAFAIANFVLNALINISGAGGGGGQQNPYGGGGGNGQGQGQIGP